MVTLNIFDTPTSDGDDTPGPPKAESTPSHHGDAPKEESKGTSPSTAHAGKIGVTDREALRAQLTASQEAAATFVAETETEIKSLDGEITNAIEASGAAGIAEVDAVVNELNAARERAIRIGNANKEIVDKYSTQIKELIEKLDEASDDGVKGIEKAFEDVEGNLTTSLGSVNQGPNTTDSSQAATDTNGHTT